VLYFFGFVVGAGYGFFLDHIGVKFFSARYFVAFAFMGSAILLGAFG